MLSFEIVVGNNRGFSDCERAAVWGSSGVIGVIARGNGDEKDNEDERRFFDLNEPDGEEDPLLVLAAPLLSSAITKSGSVRSALKRLLTATIVCVECSESAMDTGREERLETDASSGRMVLKLMLESLFRQISLISAFS